MIAIIDCGTTNAKCYLTDTSGALLAEKYETILVDPKNKDKTEYRQFLRNMVQSVIEQASRSYDELKAVIAFGMISSDVGLMVVPHLTAPAGVQDLADGIHTVEDTSIFGSRVRFCMIRGIKNRLETERSIQNLGSCDFMRGEETQVIGVLDHYKPEAPFNVISLGTHCKIIHVNRNMQIERSMTTMSGKTFDFIANATIVGKSISVQPGDFPLESCTPMIELAEEMLSKYGFLRAILLPRFMESFTALSAAERLVFLESVLALEDVRALGDFTGTGPCSSRRYFIIGQELRSRVMKEVLMKYKHAENITMIGGKENNRNISIKGVLRIAGHLPFQQGGQK